MSIRTKPIVGLITTPFALALSAVTMAHPGFGPHSHEAGIWDGLAHPFGWLGSLAVVISLGVGVYFTITRSKKGGHEYQREDHQPDKQR